MVLIHQKPSRSTKAGTDIEDVLGRLEVEFGSAVFESEVAVVVHAVERGGVGVGPGWEMG